MFLCAGLWRAEAVRRVSNIKRMGTKSESRGKKKQPNNQTKNQKDVFSASGTVATVFQRASSSLQYRHAHRTNCAADLFPRDSPPPARPPAPPALAGAPPLLLSLLPSPFSLLLPSHCYSPLSSVRTSVGVSLVPLGSHVHVSRLILGSFAIFIASLYFLPSFSSSAMTQSVIQGMHLAYKQSIIA